MEQRIRSEGRRAGGVVAQDVRDQVRVLGTDDLFAFGLFKLVDDSAFMILDAQDTGWLDAHTQVGERGVGRGQVEQGHISAAEGERESVVIPGEG